MVKELLMPKHNSNKVSKRIPENKYFFEKMAIPILLGMSVIMIGLIFFAIAVIFGLVNF